MKKIVKYVLPLFACAVLALSLSACGKIAGSKYKYDKDAKAVLSFSGKTEFSFSYDGKEQYKGTYKVEKKTITCKAKVKNPQTNKESEETMTLEIQDNKKTKLKDKAGDTWTKMK